MSPCLVHVPPPVSFAMCSECVDMTIIFSFVSACFILFPAWFLLESLALCFTPYGPTTLFNVLVEIPNAAFRSPPQISSLSLAMYFIQWKPLRHSHSCDTGLSLVGAYVDTTNMSTVLPLASVTFSSTPSHRPSFVHA